MATGSEGWTDGYTAEVAYRGNYYPGQSPCHLHLISLLQRNRPGSLEAPFTYCELGCGEGMVTNILAAVFPQARFYANDFNPAHIREARQVAAEAGLDNVTFLEHSFAALKDAPELPQFDYVTLHGVYTWISPENRAHIVDFLNARLKPGGLVYVGYNAYPGWAALMPVRRLLADYAAWAGGSVLEQGSKALDFAGRLHEAGATYFSLNPNAANFFANEIRHSRPEYMAHDYLGQHWQPLFHADLAADMERARLSFLGAANVLEHLEDYLVTPQTRPLLQSVSDRTLRETVKDFLYPRSFRRDIFVRGMLPMGAEEERRQIQEVAFVLQEARDACKLTVDMPVGEAVLAAEVYTPLLDALAAGPQTVDDLLSVPALAALGFKRVWHALATVCALHYAAPIPPLATFSARFESCERLNQTLIRRALDHRRRTFLVSPLQGSGIAFSLVDVLFLLAARHQHPNPAAFAFDWLVSQGETIIRGGEPLGEPEALRQELERLAAEFITTQQPVCRRLALLPPEP